MINILDKFVMLIPVPSMLLVCTIFVSVVLNLVLPIIFTPFASPEEIKPTNGAGNLSYKGQFMHMLVHHGQVPFTSSLIIALIVGLSFVLGKKCAKKVN